MDSDFALSYTRYNRDHLTKNTIKRIQLSFMSKTSLSPTHNVTNYSNNDIYLPGFSRAYNSGSFNGHKLCK